MNEIILGQPSISSSILAFWGVKEEAPQREAKDLLYRIFVQNCPKPIQTNPFATFWGLKNHSWMQFIDGEFHNHGPEVFDRGLHGYASEPGFLKSVFKAALFASKKIYNQLTPEYYKSIHKVACGHFDGVSTLMKAELAGEFDSGSCYYLDNLLTLFPEMSLEDQKRFEKLSEIEKKGTGYEEADEETKKAGLEELGYPDEESFLKDQDLAHQELDSLWNKAQQKIKLVNQEIKERSAQLGLDPVAHLTLESDDFPWKIVVVYQCDDPGTAVERLFSRFSKQMLVATEPSEKIDLIGDLYQMLEWIHPFRDGQGRTDLILLSTLLSKHGLNPPILKYPYYSTSCLKKEWVDYLSIGIEKWKGIKANGASLRGPQL